MVAFDIRNNILEGISTRYNIIDRIRVLLLDYLFRNKLTGIYQHTSIKQKG